MWVFFIERRTVKAPPSSCPQSISGLLRDVARIKPPKIDPTTVMAAMDLSLVHGTKKAKKAMTGLAMACSVTLKW